jgi:hypothetical protein
MEMFFAWGLQVVFKIAPAIDLSHLEVSKLLPTVYRPSIIHEGEFTEANKREQKKKLEAQQKSTTFSYVPGNNEYSEDTDSIPANHGPFFETI